MGANHHANGGSLLQDLRIPTSVYMRVDYDSLFTKDRRIVLALPGYRSAPEIRNWKWSNTQ